MRSILLSLAFAASACASSAREARSDVVIQWNQQAMSAGGPQIQRTLAMVHAAMFDAVNAIDRRYAPYLTVAPPPDGTNPQVAAAAAAYGVLVRLVPGERLTLAAALARSLADLPGGPSEQQGIAYGDLVAKAIYDARLTDNILAPDRPASFGSAPGDYRLTDPASPDPINVNAPTWKPFALTSAAQFRPEAPPALTSAAYARDFDEVKRLGGIASTARTADQTDIARWHSELGVVQFNRIARTEAAADGRTVLDHAWMFALLNLTLADTTTSVFEAKYAYRFWRPVTAIRHADTDANPDTREDLAWSPFLPTPPHPEYPSAHAALQTAGARALSAYFGRFHPFQATSSTVPGVRRSYKDFEAFAEEGKLARVLGGMHFRTSVDEGARLGLNVANWVLEHCLVPVRRP